jgi:hypothetical protein
MVKTTVYLDSDLALALREKARSEGRTQSELIREALRVYTEASHRAEIKGLGMFRSGRSDVSQRAEALLRSAARRRR